MQIHGYVIDTKYSGDGTLYLKVRIPAIHGPMTQSEYQGKPVRNYTLDQDLPYYPSNLLPSVPVYGEVVTLEESANKTYHFTVIGLTGGTYGGRWVNTGE